MVFFNSVVFYGGIRFLRLNPPFPPITRSCLNGPAKAGETELRSAWPRASPSPRLIAGAHPKIINSPAKAERPRYALHNPLF